MSATNPLRTQLDKIQRRIGLLLSGEIVAQPPKVTLDGDHIRAEFRPPVYRDGTPYLDE